jgi:hypothetical protein
MVLSLVVDPFSTFVQPICYAIMAGAGLIIVRAFLRLGR